MLAGSGDCVASRVRSTSWATVLLIVTILVLSSTLRVASGMCHACMAAEMRMSRRSSWLLGPVCGRGHDHLRAWVHAPVWCKVFVACMHKTPTGSTSPPLDPTSSPLHAIRPHRGPQSPAGVAAPARISVCDILHAQAVLHLLRNHRRRWRGNAPPLFAILTGIYAWFYMT